MYFKMIIVRRLSTVVVAFVCKCRALEVHNSMVLTRKITLFFPFGMTPTSAMHNGAAHRLKIGK